ncbi:phosphotransferase [Desertihabitans brevis]|nr:phosphotransferase [Desertihabitans brevis]
MTPADEITKVEHHLARVIAQRYDIGEPSDVRTLQATRNHTLAVTTELGRYAVRIRGEAWWIGDESELEFELDLLDHLARNGVAVSTAVRQRDGSRIGVLDHGERRTYSLFTWASGRPGARNPSGAHRVGQALAQIHVTADTFTTRHHRYALDEAAMLDRHLPAIEADLAHASPGAAAAIRAHITTIRRRLRNFDPGPGGWGVIHGDVQELNFHRDKQTVRFFDFDLCGFGWRTADIAEYYTRIPPPHRQPFLDGYETVRPLNPSEADMLLTIAQLAWIREGCRQPNLLPMLDDPFIRYTQDDHGNWHMMPPT